MEKQWTNPNFPKLGTRKSCRNKKSFDDEKGTEIIRHQLLLGPTMARRARKRRLRESGDAQDDDSKRRSAKMGYSNGRVTEPLEMPVVSTSDQTPDSKRIEKVPVVVTPNREQSAKNSRKRRLHQLPSLHSPSTNSRILTSRTSRSHLMKQQIDRLRLQELKNQQIELLRLQELQNLASHAVLTATDLSTLIAAIRIVQHLFLGCEMDHSTIELLSDAELRANALIKTILMEGFSRPIACGGLGFSYNKSRLLVELLVVNYGNLIATEELPLNAVVALGVSINDSINVLPLLEALRDSVQLKYSDLRTRFAASSEDLCLRLL